MAIPQTALVADDEKHIRTYVKLLLKQMGVEHVIEASNGEEAVTSYKEYQPDVVMLDINMPGMTGLDALPLIMAHDPEAIVIMLTGHASRHLVEHTAQAGAIHYIRKDTPQQEIREILAGLFEEIFTEE